MIASSVKLVLALAYDLCALGFAFIVAYTLRLGAYHLNFAQAEWSVFITVTLTTMLLFYFSGIYRTVIRFFNAKATMKVIGLLALASIIFYLSGHFHEAFVPRSAPIIFFAIAGLFIAGAKTTVSLVTGK